MTRVRPAEERDIRVLYLAWQELRQHNAKQDSRIRPTPVSEVDFAIAVRELRDRPRSLTLVAEEEGNFAGFLTASIETNQPDRLPERHATIGYLYVLPAYRRRGLATELVRYAFDWARQQEGISHVEMSVLEHDAAARAFWESLGFSPFIRRVWASLEPAAS